MASYGGINIFGTAVSMSTADNPRENQLNAYFGLSGLESLDGGMRGRSTHASGLLFGGSSLMLVAAEALFRSYNDGVARTLVDTMGGIWPNVFLNSYLQLGK
jgi:hypothetical protein